MANKKIKSFDPVFLASRQDTLQKFLNSVMEHPILKKSPALQAFLTLPTEKFNEVRGQIDDKHSPFSISDANFSHNGFANFDYKAIPTEDGVFRSTVNQDMHGYSVAAEELLKCQNDIFSKIKVLALQLEDEFTKASTTITSLAKEYKNLHDCTLDFSKKSILASSYEPLAKIFESNSNSLNEWSSQVLKNKDLISEYIYKDAKYSRKECDAALELVKERNIAGQGYFNAVRTLNDAKERLLTAGDPSKWDMSPSASHVPPELLLQNRLVAKLHMIPSYRDSLEKMRQLFGFYNQSLVNEFCRLGRVRTQREAIRVGNWCAERIELMENENRCLQKVKTSMGEILASEK